MKLIFSFLIVICSVSFAQNLKKEELKPISKVPKSLFLIKKAKIDNDVGEPVLYPKSKQEQSLRNEKIFRKYSLSDQL